MQHGFQHRAAERLLGLRQPAEVFESARSFGDRPSFSLRLVQARCVNDGSQQV